MRPGPLPVAGALATVPTALTIWIVPLPPAVSAPGYTAQDDAEQAYVDADPDESCIHHDLSNTMARNCNVTATMSAVSTTSIDHAHDQASAKVVAIRLYQRRLRIQCGGRRTDIMCVLIGQ